MYCKPSLTRPPQTMHLCLYDVRYPPTLWFPHPVPSSASAKEAGRRASCDDVVYAGVQRPTPSPLLGLWLQVPCAGPERARCVLLPGWRSASRADGTAWGKARVRARSWRTAGGLRRGAGGGSAGGINDVLWVWVRGEPDREIPSPLRLRSRGWGIRLASRQVRAFYTRWSISPSRYEMRQGIKA